MSWSLLASHEGRGFKERKKMKRIVIWVEDEIKEKLINECKFSEPMRTQTDVITELIKKHCKKGTK